MYKSVGIIGAGFSGLATANVFKQYGFKVKIYEKENEAGGVWTSNRRYPGLSTQNSKDTYYLSDLKMPSKYPQWPSGAQVQKYFEQYMDKQKLRELISFNTTVTKTSLNNENKWVVEYEKAGSTSEDSFDYLVVCNGIFSQPSIPSYKGMDVFKANGGKVYHTSQFTKYSEAIDKNVIVVGYGKSSCDVANSIATTTKSTTVVVRRIFWKLPKKILGFINFKYLFLTRLGENLIEYIKPKGFAKFLHTTGKPIRNFLLNSVESAVKMQLKLKKLGLDPKEKFVTIASANVSLVTDGFYHKIGKKTIKLERAEICELKANSAVLTTGTELDLDLLICGTGWKQEIPFMEKNTCEKVFDENNDYRLYKNQLPIGTHNLGFNGYNSSFFSPTTSEIGALWLAEYFTNGFTLPSEDVVLQKTDEMLAWSKERTNGKNSRGTNIIPFTFNHVDSLLEDVGINLSLFTRFNQWNVPPSPKSYNKIVSKKVEQFLSNRASDFHK